VSGMDRWRCDECGWQYEGPCRPHEPFGHTVDEVGDHLWTEHHSVESSGKAGEWQHSKVTP
jgi:hypothetical protein